ncbi:MAG: hypothetical protein H6R02_1634 [Burkholderiaceae bacterium]|jgi:hypothetical protein|nr:hypothetical protein [Burkholderiaceae bacterium]
MASSDVLSWNGLDISFQRIGRRSWSSSAILRSWAQAPWQWISPDCLALACFPTEALWLGLTATHGAVRVHFRSGRGRWTRDLDVPPDWQLSWIQSGSRKRPIALRSGCHSAVFVLSARAARKHEPKALAVTLVAPAAWRRRIGPLKLAPAQRPEPVALYSRIMPQHGP